MAINNSPSSISNNSKGFTLVELLIAMAITGIVAGAIFTAFQSQQKSYLIQDQVAEMQRNIRAAMDIMIRDIRMAGYDPTRFSGGATITDNSTSARIQVTMDLNKDHDCNDNNENITYGFSNANDADGNGIADAGAAELGRDTGGGFQPIAENIQAIGFAYAYDADGDDNLDTSAGGDIIWAVDTDGDGNWDNLDTDGDGDIDADDGPGIGNNGVINGTGTGTAVGTSQIRAVRIWILARVKRPDPDFVNTNTYVVGTNVITPNDGFRRRLLSTTVKCRNMGL
jgi:type IV pilus assembly protein PilW